MWDDLTRGAIGAVVLADARRLADCFAAIDYFEHRRIPFVVADNRFNPARTHGGDELRDALALGPEVPVVACDARDRASAKATLIALVEHALIRARAR
jgi:signal recognition particle receptor subunit beta